MTGYLVRRVLWAAALFFVITFVTYILFFVVPTGVQRSGIGRAPETIDVRRATGTSGSLPSEYWQFLKGIAHGSLGRSSSSRREVRDVLVNAAPVTGSLVLGGALVWLALAVPIGFLSALRPRSLLDSGRARAATPSRASAGGRRRAGAVLSQKPMRPRSLVT